MESFENVEIGVVRLGFVKVVHVGAAPTEGLALGAFQAARVDRTRGENFLLLGTEVFPDHANHADLGEVTGGEGKISGSASQNILYAAGGRGDVVKCDGTHNQYAHALCFALGWSGNLKQAGRQVTPFT